MGTYELAVRRRFSAAHAIRGHPGPCARLHGHNYDVEVVVAGSELDERGILVDFGELKTVCDAVLTELDHALLDDLAAFADQNATSENIARHVHREVSRKLAGVHLDRVTVWETPDSSVTYRES